MKKLPTILLSAAVVFIGFSSHLAQAANYTVVMGPAFNLVYTPANITVGQGDTVTWTNASSTIHSTTSGTVPSFNQMPDGLWNSGQFAANGSFSLTFNNFATNTYPYYCTVHLSAMVGTLTVTNDVPQPPPTLGGAALPGGQFQFSVNGLIGQKYAVQSSPDLTAWTAISTNRAVSANLVITDPAATNSPVGFYRVLEIP